MSAFEQSLSNMTQRFHHLSATAERKDDELTDLRQTIELLRKQSIQAGLTSAHMQSMGVQSNNAMGLAGTAPHTGHMSKTSNCNTSPMHNASAAHGYTTGTPIRGLPQSSSSTGGEIAMAAGRHLSSDSMCSLNSISSGCSAQEKKKKKGWVSGYRNIISTHIMLLNHRFSLLHSCEARSPRPSRGMQKSPRLVDTLRGWEIPQKTVTLLVHHQILDCHHLD